MNAFLNPHNGTSLTGVIDLTAHSISLFQENEPLKNINDMFLLRTDISIAEPIDVQIDELGNNTSQMYQPVGIINDDKVGLEPLLNYMNKNFSSKDDPAINEHHYRITKKQYNEETHNIYNVDGSKSHKTNNRNVDDNNFILKALNHEQFNELHNNILSITVGKL